MVDGLELESRQHLGPLAVIQVFRLVRAITLLEEVEIEAFFSAHIHQELNLTAMIAWLRMTLGKKLAPELTEDTRFRVGGRRRAERL